MRLLHVLAAGWIAILDMAVGMFVVYMFEEDLGEQHYLSHYIIGACLGVLPDLDIVLAFPYTRKKRSETKPTQKAVDHHQSLPHRPLLILPIAVSVAYFLGGGQWAIITAVCLFWHYLHDTHPLGGGLAWLWPFSRMYISLVPMIPPLRPEDSVMATPNLQVWWVEKNVFVPTVRCVAETVISTTLITIILSDLWGAWIGLAFGIAEWLVVIGMWLRYASIRRIPSQ